MDLNPLSEDSEVDPTFVMLDESDDEETIAQEELLEPEIDPQEELLILADDLNVSLEELKAQSGSHRSKRNRKKVDYQAMLLEEQLKKKSQNVVIGQPKSLVEMCSELVQDMKVSHPGPSTNTSTDTISVSELTKFYLINVLSNKEDEEADKDYKPMLKPNFTSEIRTGPLYQAEVPEEGAECTSADGEVQCIDKLMWRPSASFNETDLDAYLCRVNRIVESTFYTTESSSLRSYNRDNEKALEILLQSNFNVDLAVDVFKQTFHQLLNRGNVTNETNNDIASPPKIPKQ